MTGGTKGEDSVSLAETANKEAKDEITDYTVYKKLSESEKKSEFKEAYSRLADAEQRHY